MSQPPNLPPAAPPADDPDATVLVPTARGRGAVSDPASGGPGAAVPPPRPVAAGFGNAAGSAMAAASVAAAAAAAPAADLSALSGLNPLVESANPLLAAVPRIRTSATHPDPAGLREQLVRGIQGFESAARERGVKPETVLISRYALCTLLDEAVASTPWGGTANWAQASLLVTFHRETWGGEKFFQLLDRLLADPASDPQLLELFYVCLALGFEGRYRVVENGRVQLEALRERLFEVVRARRGEFERDLSPHWRGQDAPVHEARGLLPLWVAAAAAAALLIVIFIGLKLSLAERSDAVAALLDQANAPQAKIARQAPPVPPAPVVPRLSKLLAAEIAERRLEVVETATESRVTIRSDGLFRPGSATVEDGFVPILRRVAEAVNSVEGMVVVEGYTDNRPIRTVRFPSNYELSQERAASVVRVMAPVLADPSRVRATGLADARPLAPNDSDDNRARNRRVEIVVKGGS
jgi:type VI secretion system protein ImpK